MTLTAFMQAFDGADSRPPVVVSGQTTSASVHTRSSHAHGRAYTPKAAIPYLEGTADDNAESPLGAVIEIVSIDATNVIVKCATASQPFGLVVFP